MSKENDLQKELLERQEENEMMESVAREHLVDFCILTNPRYDPNWHHDVIGKQLEEIESGEFQKQGFNILMIFAPPRHGKSQETTIAFPAWFLGKHPDKDVITASHSGDLATKFGKETRELVGSPAYRQIFGLGLKEDDQAAGRWKTDKGGSYMSVGIGGSITGFGADLALLDDPIKNREEANSEVFREKNWSWWKSTFYTRLQPGGVMVIILTRWHQDDLAGRILADPVFSKKVKVIKFTALAEEDELPYRRQGEALWEGWFPKADLEDFKRADIFEFSALYQQTPIISEAQEFKQEYFTYFEEEEIASKLNIINIFVDPAISKKKQACDTGIIDVGKINNKNEWYILDDTSGKIDPESLVSSVIDKVIFYREQYKDVIVNVCIETVAFQEALAYWFKSEMRRQNIFFNIKEIKTHSDKTQRIKGLIPFYKNGVIKHRSRMRGDKLEEQLIMFPFGKLIDRADALSFNVSFESRARRITFVRMEDNVNKGFITEDSNPLSPIVVPQSMSMVERIKAENEAVAKQMLEEERRRFNSL